MKIKPPSEKLVEMLFIRYLFQLFKQNDILLFAPTTREEYEEGYDTKIIGQQGCFELCLQFKTPTKTQEGSTIRLNDHQHATLLRPSLAAFYLSHTFHNLKNINECQRTASGPNDFLRRCLAVDVKCLNRCTDFIQFQEAKQWES